MHSAAALFVVGSDLPRLSRMRGLWLVCLYTLVLTAVRPVRSDDSFITVTDYILEEHHPGQDVVQAETPNEPELEATFPQRSLVGLSAEAQVAAHALQEAVASDMDRILKAMSPPEALPSVPFSTCIPPKTLAASVQAITCTGGQEIPVGGSCIITCAAGYINDGPAYTCDRTAQGQVFLNGAQTCVRACAALTDAQAAAFGGVTAGGCGQAIAVGAKCNLGCGLGRVRRGAPLFCNEKTQSFEGHQTCSASSTLTAVRAVMGMKIKRVSAAARFRARSSLEPLSFVLQNEKAWEDGVTAPSADGGAATADASEDGAWATFVGRFDATDYKNWIEWASGDGILWNGIASSRLFKTGPVSGEVLLKGELTYHTLTQAAKLVGKKLHSISKTANSIAAKIEARTGLNITFEPKMLKNENDVCNLLPLQRESSYSFLAARADSTNICYASRPNMFALYVSPGETLMKLVPPPFNAISGGGLAVAKQRELRGQGMEKLAFGWGKDHQIIPQTCLNGGTDDGCAGHVWIQLDGEWTPLDFLKTGATKDVVTKLSNIFDMKISGRGLIFLDFAPNAGQAVHAAVEQAMDTPMTWSSFTNNARIAPAPIAAPAMVLASAAPSPAAATPAVVAATPASAVLIPHPPSTPPPATRSPRIPHPPSSPPAVDRRSQPAVSFRRALATARATAATPQATATSALPAVALNAFMELQSSAHVGANENKLMAFAKQLVSAAERPSFSLTVDTSVGLEVRLPLKLGTFEIHSNARVYLQAGTDQVVPQSTRSADGFYVQLGVGAGYNVKTFNQTRKDLDKNLKKLKDTFSKALKVIQKLFGKSTAVTEKLQGKNAETLFAEKKEDEAQVWKNDIKGISVTLQVNGDGVSLIFSFGERSFSFRVGGGVILEFCMRWSKEDQCAGINLVKLVARASKGAINYVVEAFQNGAARISTFTHRLLAFNNKLFVHRTDQQLVHVVDVTHDEPQQVAQVKLDVFETSLTTGKPPTQNDLAVTVPSTSSIAKTIGADGKIETATLGGAASKALWADPAGVFQFSTTAPAGEDLVRAQLYCEVYTRTECGIIPAASMCYMKDYLASGATPAGSICSYNPAHFHVQAAAPNKF